MNCAEQISLPLEGGGSGVGVGAGERPRLSLTPFQGEKAILRPRGTVRKSLTDKAV